MTHLELILRLLLSIICGMMVGYEREKKAKGAGIRTHTIVAMSSALMMIVSKYGFFDIIHMQGITLDASRIGAGVVTAIGFLGAGIIFERQESVISGITTAAGLWATVGVGIAIGAGMYIVGISSAALLLIVQLILHRKSTLIKSRKNGSLIILLTEDDLKKQIERILASLENEKIIIRYMKIIRQPNGCKILLQLTLPYGFHVEEFYITYRDHYIIESVQTCT